MVRNSNAGAKAAAFSKSNSSTNPHRKLPDGKLPGHYRDKATINRLNMYKNKPNEYERYAVPNAPMRIEPDRRWFGNTRVITQDKLELFRKEYNKANDDPYNVILKHSKLPTSLLEENFTPATVRITDVESFSETFGPGQQRKRPKLAVADFEEMAAAAADRKDGYSEEKDSNFRRVEEYGGKKLQTELVLEAGTSRRIWGELYKVVDSSDVIIFVLDARDPEGTRCKYLEDQLRKERPHVHQILLLNKVDLIPTWAAQKWTRVLSRERPTLAFHASITNAFGKSALINLLRQFSTLHKDKKHLSVGLLGYPNVGKSSVINTIVGKKAVKAAPIPGETKNWQYVAVTNRIYMIDCPGVVPTGVTDASKIFKGVVRAERLDQPSQYVSEALGRVKEEYLKKHFNLPLDFKWRTPEELLEAIAKKNGKLLKKGEPDVEIAARMLINDWQRGRIPFFVAPPGRKGVNPVEEANAIRDAENAEVVAAEEEAELNKLGTGLIGADGNPLTGERKLKKASEVDRRVRVRQDFGSLACMMDFDEEDAKMPEGYESEEEEVAEEEVVVEGADKEDEEDTAAGLAEAEAAAKELIDKPDDWVEGKTAPKTVANDGRRLKKRRL